jgi:hypothetical protein
MIKLLICNVSPVRISIWKLFPQNLGEAIASWMNRFARSNEAVEILGVQAIFSG